MARAAVAAQVRIRLKVALAAERPEVTFIVQVFHIKLYYAVRRMLLQTSLLRSNTCTGA